MSALVKVVPMATKPWSSIQKGTVFEGAATSTTIGTLVWNLR